MATSAGLQCEIDPVLCQALRAHKGGSFSVFFYFLISKCHLSETRNKFVMLRINLRPEIKRFLSNCRSECELIIL